MMEKKDVEEGEANIMAAEIEETGQEEDDMSMV